MDPQTKRNVQRQRRRGRVRRRVRGIPDRPRLTVSRSGRHIAAQVIDDLRGRTLAAASTYQKDVSGGLNSTAGRGAAQRVGTVLAERAKAAGIQRVVFDRGHCQYHGRIAALAQAAREAGLEF